MIRKKFFVHLTKKCYNNYTRSKLVVSDFRAHSSMDRVSACGAEDTSSIPVGRRSLKEPFLRREMALFSYFLDGVF